MKKLLTVLLCALLLLPAFAFAAEPDESYVSYESFLASYTENMEYINEINECSLACVPLEAEDSPDSYGVYSFCDHILTVKLYTLGNEERIVGAMFSVTDETKTFSSNDYRDGCYHIHALIMAMKNFTTYDELEDYVMQFSDGFGNQNSYTLADNPYTVTCSRDEQNGTESVIFSSEYWSDPQSVTE